MSAHWGEMPTQPETASGIAAIEREQIIKPRPMEVEGPPLHQPSSKPYPPTTEQHPSAAFAIDPITLHTVKLIQYSRRLRSLILNTQQQLESLKIGDGEFPSFPASPPIPEYSGNPPEHQLQKPVPFLPKNCDSQFARGMGHPPPEIDSTTNRKLLRRSVSAICAHAGFDNCAESILETMTDMCQEYYTQFTQLLRRAVDSEARHGSTGFADPMEQVFYEMGIGSPVVLHDFYQNRIINYHQNIMRTCEKLKEDYERIRSPENRPNEEYKPSIKEEPLSDIQFPILDDVDDNGDTEQVLHLESLGLEINIVNDAAPSLTTEDDSQKWSQTSIKQEPCEAKAHRARSFAHPSLVIPPNIALSHVKKKLYEKVSKRAGVSTLDSYDQEDPHGDSIGSVPSTPVMGIPHTPGGDSIGNPGSVSVCDIMSPPPTSARKPPKKKKKR